jgi:hypothetical protein
MSGKRARLVKEIRGLWPTLSLNEKCLVMKAYNLHNWNNQRLPWRGQAVLDATTKTRQGVGA